MRKIIITLFLLVGTIAYGQTHGDVSLSKTADIKKHFTKKACDQILTDTFTICYDFEWIATGTAVTIAARHITNIPILTGALAHGLVRFQHQSQKPGMFPRDYGHWQCHRGGAPPPAAITRNCLPPSRTR